MTKHMATELITGVNHFQSLIDKPIKLEISLKSSWRSSQLECKTESARIEAYFSLYTSVLPLTSALSHRLMSQRIDCLFELDCRSTLAVEVSNTRLLIQ